RLIHWRLAPHAGDLRSRKLSLRFKYAIAECRDQRGNLCQREHWACSGNLVGLGLGAHERNDLAGVRQHAFPDLWCERRRARLARCSIKHLPGPTHSLGLDSHEGFVVRGQSLVEAAFGNYEEVAMAFYVVWDAEISNRPGLEPYVAAVSDTIAKHGGRYLARAGATKLIEGKPEPKVIVILEFPDAASFD